MASRSTPWTWLAVRSVGRSRAPAVDLRRHRPSVRGLQRGLRGQPRHLPRGRRGAAISWPGWTPATVRWRARTLARPGGHGPPGAGGHRRPDPTTARVAPDGTVLLTDRAPGTHEVNALPSAERHAVYDDYLDAVADLHDVDTTALDLPASAPHRRPLSRPQRARPVGRHPRCTTRRPWPLARYTLAVLRELAPTVVDRTVLCHGDVGPGNFLHEGGRVTALLDWEFAHLGDPMDDLGWWVFRGHDMRGDCGDLGAQLARWSARPGSRWTSAGSRTTGSWSCCAGSSRSPRPWSAAASG